MAKKVETIWPRWVQTIGNMQRELEKGASLEVKAVCAKCGGEFRVEIDLLVRAFGPEFSLIDQRGRCRMRHCDGGVVFLYSNGPGTPFRPLVNRY